MWRLHGLQAEFGCGWNEVSFHQLDVNFQLVLGGAFRLKRSLYSALPCKEKPFAVIPDNAVGTEIGRFLLIAYAFSLRQNKYILNVYGTHYSGVKDVL